MTKEKIIKMLKAYIDKTKHEAKVCESYNRGEEEYRLTQSKEYWLGEAKAYKNALLLVEAMHDDEYWNETIADAIAMGDR